MNDYDTVEEQVKRSKIFRFSYPKIIGESLTRFVTKQRQQGFNSNDIVHNLLELKGVQDYFNKFPMMKQHFIKNVKISVSSRCAEQESLKKNELLL